MSITNPSVQGIASMFRGTPGALQANIQKDQKANPSLPPDLTKALALNIDLNEQDAGKKQMAMQQLQQLQAQGGKPPTIMQKLEQQAQMKQQQQQEQMMKQAMQARMQQAQAQQAQQPQQPAGLPAGLPQEAPQPEAQGIDQAPSNLQMASGGIVAFDVGGRGADKDAGPESSEGTAAATQPDFTNLLEKRIREELAVNPHTVATEDAGNAERLMGIKDLLKEKEARVAQTQQLQEAQKADRTPGWMTWAHDFATADPRKGFGFQAGIAGAGSEKAREAYAIQDRAFNTEINRLKDGLLDAQLEGNKAKVKAYTDALNRVRQEQSNALTSGTSLQNTREQAAARIQAAKDAAAARADAIKNKPPVEGLQEIASLVADLKDKHPEWTPAQVQAEATREYLRLKNAGISGAVAKSHADAVKEVGDWMLMHKPDFDAYAKKYHNGDTTAARDALIDNAMKMAVPSLNPPVTPIDVLDKPGVNNNSTTAPKKGTVRMSFDEKGNPK